MLLGKPQVAAFSARPLFIWTKHFASVRNAMIQHLGVRDFTEAFMVAVNSARAYDVYAIICTHLWHSHRDEYSWHFQERPPGRLKDMRTWPAEPTKAYTAEPAIHIAQDMRSCSKRSCLKTVEGKECAPETVCNVQQLILEGYCHSTQHNKTQACERYKKVAHDMLLYQDQLGPGWPAHSRQNEMSGIRTVLDHYNEVKHLDYEWPDYAKAEIQKIETEGDPQKWCHAQSCTNKYRFAQKYAYATHVTARKTEKLLGERLEDMTSLWVACVLAIVLLSGVARWLMMNTPKIHVQ
eukprot:TRINITY_DN13441_c0_g3_i11.p2 TRINITY_DN13441_c0_g3~~TRINITY_DN13441_c0_g3_i11.p2  ORF type:complete len:294 (+),score=54.23 TRINITY_DN13441_c0_g3_i11:314-1195(+)